ncbi:MAG: DegT/DnrJ/EryC1/StrS family aminotransferase [Lachnospiraceae bacterium]|nr:DegT/DnrJ/EryC1/StrS family aminotransferase [Lachnospiraceae bacterium]
MDKIPQSRLDRGFQEHQKEYEEKALSVLRSGWYVLGEEVKNFEQEYASYIGTKHCVGLANGLDALWITFRVLGIGPGDEVIVQGNTYIASVMGITMNGATPVFVEPDRYYQIDAEKIEEKITDKTKAVLVVHLYGQAAQMSKVREICDRHGLLLVEDCAQSHGARWEGRMTGSFGDVGCWSFYPSKNLGAFGDAGAVTTDRDDLAEAFRVFRNYGSEKRYYNKVVGANSRLDELQAGLLRVRLGHLPELNEERKKQAAFYEEHIDNPLVIKPEVREGSESVWHQYVLRVPQHRDALRTCLEEKGVGTLIHYPIPPHLSEAYAYLGKKEGSYPVTEQYAKEVLSLPLYAGMTKEEQQAVADAVNAFRVL